MSIGETKRELEQIAIVEDYISDLVWSAETSIETRGAVEANLRAFWSHINAIAMRAWPAELTDDLRSILGMMCFQLGHMAHAYRDLDGQKIAPRAEDEQAFMLHRLLGFWFEHGDGWRKAAGEDLQRVLKKSDTQVPA